MSTGAKIAAAVAGGYLLGRTKKLKMAVMLGGLLAGRRLASDPGQLLKQAGDYIDSNPELAKLSEQVQSRLVDAGRAAAISAASSRLDKLSDAIQDRTELLQSRPSEDEYDDEGDEPTDEEPSDEEPEDESEDEPADESEEEPEEEPERPRRRPKKSATSRKSGGGKPAPAKKTAKKATRKSAPAKKSASSRSRSGRSRSDGNKG